MLVLQQMKKPETTHSEFLRLFLSKEQELFRYIVTFVGNLEEAQDILQETAITLMEKFADYDSDRPFFPWACRFALNKIKQSRTRNMKWVRFLDDETINVLASRRNELSEELDQRRLYLRQCLEKLPDTHLDVISGYYHEAIPIEDLSQRSGKSVSAIYKILQRVRKQLMDCIERQMAIEANGG